jgi:hypothetical protein
VIEAVPRTAAARPLSLARAAAAVAATVALAGCGAAGSGVGHGAKTVSTPGIAGLPAAHPQSVDPTSTAGTTPLPVGDVNAHAPPLSVVRHELHLELVYAPVSSAGYVDPLQYVTTWERTDQGVDAQLPVGAPILAPGPVKILAVISGWYAGQPLVYFELLNGPDAGKVQYVAEQITDIARPGSILTQGETIARFAKSGTGIEYGWSTPSGITLAVATTGYEEGQITPAGRAIRSWLNSLGAGAGRNT